MAKHFKTVLSNGTVFEFAKNAWAEAKNVQNYDAAQTFFLAGKQVTAQAYYAEAEQLGQVWFDRKNETHKLVRVRYGSSVACYVWKWIPR